MVNTSAWDRWILPRLAGKPWSEIGDSGHGRARNLSLGRSGVMPGKRGSGPLRPQEALERLLQEGEELQRGSAELADQVEPLRALIQKEGKVPERRARPRL